MSTREIAYEIVNRLNEKQLKDFIAAFGKYGGNVIEEKPTDAEINERLAALKELEEMLKEAPDLDYDKALAEYREEKYGI